MERFGIQLERPKTRTIGLEAHRRISIAEAEKNRGGGESAAVNFPGESFKHYLESRVGHKGHVAQIEA